jgi:Ni,Fe-hydrogenase I large subunit
MATTLTIDPMTRIEGHLKIKAEVEDHSVKKAYSAGEMFRGFEIFLKNRSPLDAPMLTQRICGVCPQAHGQASIMALDDAFGVLPPSNGRIIRNLLLGANFLQSHILHFYHLTALDYVDITAILQYNGADPKLNRIKNWVQKDIEDGFAFAGAPFLPRYEGDYIADTELNIHAIAHYVKALEIRRKAHEMLSIFGGKMPHCMTIFAGGVSQKPTVDNIYAFKTRLKEIKQFVDHYYVPDVLTVAKAYPEYFSIGKGEGNYISYGGMYLNDEHTETLFAPGVYLDGKIEEFNPDYITEHLLYSKYDPEASGSVPFEGLTNPSPDKTGAYSFLKAPRYKNSVMECGPLARTYIAYLKKSNPNIVSLVNYVLSELNAPVEALNSTMGRHAARVIEAKIVAERMMEWLDALKPGEPIHTAFKIPKSASGKGLTSAPRGELGHWITIKNKKIDNYQAIVPTTWNGSPRDDEGKPGPFEVALVDTPVKDHDNPIEIGRVIRSFDPCLACSIHILDAKK